MAGQASVENGKLGGRPKGSVSLETKKKHTFEKLFIRAVYKEKKEIIQKAIEKAKSGEVKAIVDILNRMMGRPTEHLDLTSKGDQILVNVVNYKNDNRHSIPVPTEEVSTRISNESSEIQDSSISQKSREDSDGTQRTDKESNKES